MNSRHAFSAFLFLFEIGLGGVVDAAPFADWVRTYGQTHNMHTDRLWLQPMTPNGQPFRIARLCEGEDKNGFHAEHVAYLLDDQQSRRFVLTFQQEHRVYCDDEKESYYGHLRRRSARDLILYDVSASHQELQYWIDMRGGEPVVVGQTEWLADHATLKGPMYADDTSEDWDALVLRARQSRIDLDGDLVFDRRAAIIPVLREPNENPPLVQSVQGRWDGANDASLQAYATPLEDGRVRLHIDVRDDVQTLTFEDATDAELSRADHLQLWHCFSGEMKELAECHELHALRLAFTRGGRWIVRGSDADPQLRPPEVTGTATAAGIILDVGAGKDGGRKGWRRSFTIVYSDVDGQDKPTRISTSRLAPKDSNTFGLLVALPGYRRYPAIGSDDKIPMSVKTLER